MAESLRGKIVLITGASAGVGKACAEQFAAQGAHVILTARRFERITELAETLQQQHGVKALPIKLDVSDKQQVQQVIADLDESWCAIDILVNNAGVRIDSLKKDTIKMGC
ncbi:MAG: SDR family NAD(P)-dependent oxidoreductase [Gammaproteobacteria bacterium]|nr:SDR family NAD(P)-dependent oxidoreductase [Gammaproteobacteria bacterium]